MKVFRNPRWRKSRLGNEIAMVLKVWNSFHDAGMPGSWNWWWKPTGVERMRNSVKTILPSGSEKSLPPASRDDVSDAAAVKRAVAERIGRRTADEWRVAFAGKDLCCNVVSSIREALADPAFVARKLFDAKLVSGAGSITALPMPIAAPFRSTGSAAGYPALGEANELLDASDARPQPQGS